MSARPGPLQSPEVRRRLRLDGVRKIAVLRANALGDLIFALPAYTALRQTYPEAEIVLLARGFVGELLEGRPGPVDRVEAVPRSRGVNGDEETDSEDAAVEEFLARMQAEHFDLAVQVHGGGRFSNPFLDRLGARHTVGLRAGDAPPLERWGRYVYFQHEVIRYLETVGLAGAATPDIEPQLAVIPADLEEADQVLGEVGLTANGGRAPLVVLHPGAQDKRRRWPAAGFGAVGRRLMDRGARIAVSGTDSEREIVEEVMEALHPGAADLTGRLSLRGLVGLLARSDCLVANDTGPIHVARAIGSPTVGIYWALNLVNSGPLSRNRHRTVSSWRMHCPVCGHPYMHGPCEHEVSVVAEVDPDAVYEQVVDLLVAEGAMPSRPADVGEQPSLYLG